MKLRMQKDSIRLRITRSELARLKAGQPLVEIVRFGGDGTFQYSLERSDQEAPVDVRFSRNRLTVILSHEAVRTWLGEKEVGIYASLPLPGETALQVTVEKDFACLDRSDEENADAFSNPRLPNICE